MAYRLQSDLAARETELVSQASLLHLFPAKGKNNSSKRKQIVSGTSTTDGAGKSSTVAGTTAGAAGTVTTDAGGGEEEDEQVREAVFYRLDKLGYRVGQGLVER